VRICIIFASLLLVISTFTAAFAGEKLPVDSKSVWRPQKYSKVIGYRFRLSGEDSKDFEIFPKTNRMKPFAIAISLAASLLLGGCGPVEEHRIVGPYRLMAMDTRDQMSIWCGKWGRVDETVFAVGFDNRYIVAKQHPKGDRSLTNYFYIDMAADSPDEPRAKHVTGPLSEPAFLGRKKQLGLPPFTRIIPSLQ
jgi:hypothetical protein